MLPNESLELVPWQANKAAEGPLKVVDAPIDVGQPVLIQDSPAWMPLLGCGFGWGNESWVLFFGDFSHLEANLLPVMAKRILAFQKLQKTIWKSEYIFFF